MIDGRPSEDQPPAPVATGERQSTPEAREMPQPEPGDPIDEVIAGSFPASDPPPWWAGPR